MKTETGKKDGGSYLDDLSLDECLRLEMSMGSAIARLIKLCELHGAPDCEVLLCIAFSTPKVFGNQLGWSDERLMAAAKRAEDMGVEFKTMRSPLMQ